MPAWLNQVTIAAPSNGTTTHAVNPASGTAVAGSLFTPTAGRFLLLVVEGSVTSTTPSGWTLPTNGSAINNTGLYVWYKASASGGDTISTTHNSSNYPVAFSFFEFPAGTTFVKAATATGTGLSAANPTISALTGTNTVMGAAGVAVFGGSNSATWNSPNVEAVDTFATTGPTGYWSGVSYQDSYVSATYAPTPTISIGSGGSNSERLTFAVNPPAGGGTTYERSAAVAATGAVTVADRTFWTTFERSAATAATGTLAVTAYQRERLRQIAIAAAGAITSTGQRDRLRQAALTATAAITAAPQRDLQRSTALSAAATIAAAYQHDHNRQADLSAATAIATTGQIEGGAATVERAATLTATGAITATATFWSTLERSAAATSAAAVTVIAYQREHQRQATVNTTGTITVAGEIEGAEQRAASITATGAIQVAYIRVHVRQTTLTSAANIQVGYQRYHLRQATLTAAGLITTTGTVNTTLERALTLTALGAITASGDIGSKRWYLDDPTTRWPPDTTTRWPATTGSRWD